MLVDPVTQAAVNAGIAAGDVTQSVVETVVSTTMSQVVDIPTSGAEVAVGEAVGIPHGQVHIMEVTDGTAVATTDAVQAAIGEAMQTAHVTVEGTDTLGITVPAEILAAMAAAQSHPHLLIATADQQLMQAQVAAATAAAEQQVLEAQAVVQPASGMGQTSEESAQLGDSEVNTSAPGEQQQQLEQPMETD